MKKILVLMLVALLVVVLVACGGDDTTTKKPEGTTGGTVTTTGGTTTTGGNDTTDLGEDTEDPDDTEDPEDTLLPDGATDIILDYMGLDDRHGGVMTYYTFEDTHGSLDFNTAVVMIFNSNGSAIFQELFIPNAEGSALIPNNNYTWVFKVDGREFECKAFSLFDYSVTSTGGWVRASLGPDFKYEDFTYEDDGEGNKVHGYMVELSIYNADDRSLVYYANLNQIEPYMHTYVPKPTIVRDPDADLDATIPYSNINADGGPDSGTGEGYQNLLDNDCRSKLCTGDFGPDHPLTFTFANAVNLAGIGIVNANDNKAFTGRTVVAFDVYVSTNGIDWSETPDISIDKTSDYQSTDTEGNVVTDKSPASDDYTENYYAFGKVLEGAKYIKIVINNNEMYQISELYFYEG